MSSSRMQFMNSADPKGDKIWINAGDTSIESDCRGYSTAMGNYSAGYTADSHIRGVGSTRIFR